VKFLKEMGGEYAFASHRQRAGVFCSLTPEKDVYTPVPRLARASLIESGVPWIWLFSGTGFSLSGFLMQCKKLKPTG
jgi:hypothetical protein